LIRFGVRPLDAGIRRQQVDRVLCIRRATPDDYAGIVALLKCCFADEGPEIGGTPDTLESVAKLQASGDELLVLEKENVIVGFVEVNPRRRAAFKLAVLPPWRRRGIGQSLMEAAEKYAVSSGWGELLVGVMKAKPTLVQYYSRLGYLDEGREEVLATQPGYVGPESRITIMRKPL
jgi:ribosomal protein S18 acetylase RimI-like enzyme